jgi:16S rRNA G1207 methylase RsmC
MFSAPTTPSLLHSHHSHTGLATLSKTEKDVAELQVDLSHTMVQVEEKVKATDALMITMAASKQEAGRQQAIAEVEKGKATVAAAGAAKIEKSAEAELAEAKPGTTTITTKHYYELLLRNTTTKHYYELLLLQSPITTHTTTCTTPPHTTPPYTTTLSTPPLLPHPQPWTRRRRRSTY